MILNAKSSYFKNLNPRNKKQFWKAVKCLNKQQSTIPTLHHQGTAAESDSEKASLLNECFSACFKRDTTPLSSANDDHHTVHFSPCPDELLCTAEEAIFLIMSLDPSKANRPDESQLKCLKVRPTALLHPSPNFSISPFAKVTSLSAGKHLHS